MSRKNYINLPDIVTIVAALWLLFWFLIAIYNLNINDSEIQIEVLDYKVGRCFITHNNTGPFIITKIDDYLNYICVKKYTKNPKYNILSNTTGNVAINAEGCMPESFWDSTIDEYNWKIVEDCK